jgi:hypothetical protein
MEIINDKIILKINDPEGGEFSPQIKIEYSIEEAESILASYYYVKNKHTKWFCFYHNKEGEERNPENNVYITTRETFDGSNKQENENLKQIVESFVEGYEKMRKELNGWNLDYINSMLAKIGKLKITE